MSNNGAKVPEDTFNRKSGQQEDFYMEPKPNGRIDSIEVSLKSDLVCSNQNRVAILHVLSRCPRNEIQAEKLAQIIGVSHRTVLYHLDILEDYELVEVKGFRKKGQKMLRSVWGLNTDHVHTEKVFKSVMKKFPPQEVFKIIRMNGYSRQAA
jgi:DNA-binding transcriptional ArsR family regulator